MDCLHPHTILNPHWVKYESELEALPKFPHDLYITIGCGKCLHCRRKKQNDWRVRLQHELYYGNYNHCEFVTLTFNSTYYERFKTCPERAFRLFLERYRKVYGCSIRHFAVTELGGQYGRLHLHCIFFDYRFEMASDSFKRVRYTPEQMRILNTRRRYGPFLKNDGTLKRYVADLKRFWKYGRVWVDGCYETTASYLVKYITKPYEEYVESPADPDFVKSFVPKIFCSPGLGRAYVNDPSVIEFHRQTLKGIWYIQDRENPIIKYAMPRYYVEKIFDKDFRTDLAYQNWLDPPPFRKTYAGFEYTDEDAYRAQLLSVYQNTLRTSKSYKVRNYIPRLISLRKISEWVSNASSEKELLAIKRTLAGIGKDIPYYSNFNHLKELVIYEQATSISIESTEALEF